MKRITLRLALRSLLIVASAGLLVGSLVLVTPEVDAGPPGRGSVRHSSKGGGRSAQRPSSGGRKARSGGSSRSGRSREAGRGPDRSGRRDAGGTRKRATGPDRNRGDRRGAGGARPGTPGRGQAGSGRSRGGARAGYRAGRADRRYSARKDARRDYYRFRTVNHLLRLGAYVATRPRYTTTVVVTGGTYYYTGGVYYVSSGSGYVVVHAPPGAVVYAVPAATTIVYSGRTAYYYYGGTYYVPSDQPAPQPEATSEDDTEGGTSDAPEMIDSDHTFEVIEPPIGATVPYVPEEAEGVKVNGRTYFVFEGTYYQPFASDGETIYMVVEDPTQQ